MGTSGARFLGVRQRPAGRWVADIKVSSQKLRLGTYDRPEEAARAYDFAARLLRASNAKTNFPLMNESSVIQMPLKSPRLHQLVQCEEMSPCVIQETVVYSVSEREGLSAGLLSSSGQSKVYSSVVVAPFAGGFSEERCEDMSRCDVKFGIFFETLLSKVLSYGSVVETDVQILGTLLDV